MKLVAIIVYLTFPFVLHSQINEQKFIFNQHFTDLTELHDIKVDLDSLDNFVLTDKTRDFAQDWDLSLINPQNDSRILIKLKKSPPFPHITFSSAVTNLMNNSVDHAVAFYSLDQYFIASELNADWAVDCSFVPKGEESETGYGRSFYNEKRDIQIIIILIARDIPLLHTPGSINAFRF